ncbi:hydrogenase [Pelomonas sp. P7]|uniref:Hydrogenase n=2 Tax=Pelomonas caseinilytica TaxID=2906763 RepID=A0ABS8XEH9_9BURK|nr:hydrogenase [Pelomonas sp. P7]MCE4536983.1 hydrogenase [Pelomonas sp. P7]
MNTESLLTLPVQAPQALPDTSPLVSRLAESFGASWVDADTLDAWAAQGGDRVVLFAGDAVRFPEGQDVAVVLPELQRSLPGRFQIGVVRRQDEDALARRFGSQRWPTLLFLRDGAYVTTLSGMHDWDVFLRKTEEALAMPVSRVPGIGIPLVAAGASDAGCH